MDDSCWPLVIATMPQKVSLDSLHTLEQFYERCFARRERFASVTDTTALRSLPDAVWRKRLADWLNAPAFRERNRLYNVGSATILTWAPVRATLTAIQWLWEPPSPQYYASDMRSAVDWCVERLQAEKVPVSFRLADLHASLRKRVASAQ